MSVSPPTPDNWEPSPLNSVALQIPVTRIPGLVVSTFLLLFQYKLTSAPSFIVAIVALLAWFLKAYERDLNLNALPDVAVWWIVESPPPAWYITKSDATPQLILTLSERWIKSSDKVNPAPTVTIPAFTLTLPALTTRPPVVALNPFPAVIIPTESTLVTSS